MSRHRQAVGSTKQDDNITQAASTQRSCALVIVTSLTSRL
jgi:hypothetical protein